MKTARTLAFAITALVCVATAWARSLPTAAPEEVGLSAQRLERIGQVFKQEIEQSRLPGAVALIARKGRIAYYESFGFQDKAGVYLPGVRDYDARDLTPTEQIERMAQVPLVHQPGTVWEYSLASDLLGRVVEVASGMRLADFLAQRLFKPLGMDDTGFWVAQDKLGRLAQPLPIDPASGAPNKLIDVSTAPKNGSGGAGAVSTALDYWRFAQMLLNGGQLDGTRVLSRTTINLMTADHLGTRVEVPVTPGELLLGTPGYTFGLGFAVREGAGIAGVPGSAGEYMWAGYAGTYFWVDPQEALVGVLMTQAPGPSRAYYRKLFKQLTYQAIAD